jgi:hypothetical protein
MPMSLSLVDASQSLRTRELQAAKNRWATKWALLQGRADSPLSLRERLLHSSSLVPSSFLLACPFSITITITTTTVS